MLCHPKLASRSFRCCQSQTSVGGRTRHLAELRPPPRQCRSRKARSDRRRRPSTSLMVMAVSSDVGSMTFESKDPNEKKSLYSDANFPLDPEGRTYHLETKVGEVANRVLTVGDLGRAKRLSALLEPPIDGGKIFVRQSSRGFVTITGRYNGIPLSIITSLMGTPNMDFMVRETRAVVDGQMAIVRLGTCGILRPDVKVGTVIVASEGSVSIMRNPDAFDRVLEEDGSVSMFDTSIDSGMDAHYIVTRPVSADHELSKLLMSSLSAQEVNVTQGLNATACSFYSSQGRVDESFMDCNQTLLIEVMQRYPEVASLEMETFQLLDLARCSRGSIKACAACIGLACRTSNDFMDLSKLPELEVAAGRAVLEALSACSIEDDASMGMFPPRDDGTSYVWEAQIANIE